MGVGQVLDAAVERRSGLRGGVDICDLGGRHHASVVVDGGIDDAVPVGEG